MIGVRSGSSEGARSEQSALPEPLPLFEWGFQRRIDQSTIECSERGSAMPRDRLPRGGDVARQRMRRRRLRGLDVSCVYPALSVGWQEPPASLPPNVRVCINDECGRIQVLRLEPRPGGGYELAAFEVPRHESDSWQVRVELVDESGVTARSLRGDAKVDDVGSCCGHAELAVSSDGGSLTSVP